MLFIPSKKFIFETRYTPSQVKARLRSVFRSDTEFTYEYYIGSYRYKGIVEDDFFKMQIFSGYSIRIRKNRKNIFPKTKGIIKPHNNEDASIIEVDIIMSNFSLCFINSGIYLSVINLIYVLILFLINRISFLMVSYSIFVLITILLCARFASWLFTFTAENQIKLLREVFP